MTANNISAIYPLSPLQVGMLFQNITAPESGAYVTQFVCTLRGDLDRAALRRAWEQVVERHDILRTAFVWEDVDEPLQVVGARVSLPWEESDWRGVGAAVQRERLEEFLHEDRRRGYDPSRAPLMRLSLIATGEGESAFVWSHHHLLLDGWSTALLMKEVSDLYQALCRGERPSLPPPRPFREYVAWLRRQDAAGPEAFWRETLKGASVPTPLGVDRNAFAPPRGEKSYGQREDRLSEELTAALQAAARRYRLTLNTLVQGAWGLLLGRYSGTDDVVFGTVVSGRPAELPGVERMVGMFINTLAVRARLPQEEGLLSWLQNLQAEQAQARRYEHSSLTEVQGWAGLPRGQAMFESVLVFANYPVDSGGASAEARLEVRDARLIERTDVPLTIEAAPGPELRLRVMYDEERFDGETAARLLRHLKTVLAGMAGGLEQRLADVPVLTDEERAELLAEPDALPAHGYEHLLQELFEARAAADPSAAALSFDGEVMSYAELNARSNQLAHGLRDSGLAAGRPVAVMLGGGPPHVTALLGVLKAGSPFVCLDPQYPSARLEQIMEDIGADCLVTDAASLKPHAPLAARWQSERGVTVVGLDERDVDVRRG
ncbi:MAG: condensation domain-containing protein [Pyrinomonadaceae bacterium]